MTNSLQTLSARLRSLLAPAPRLDPDQLSDPDPTARWRALRTLARQPQTDLVPQVLQLLTDPDPTIRYEAIRVLAAWGPEFETLQPAADLLASDPPTETAITILDLLSESPLPAIHGLVRDRLKHEDAGVRAAAARALGAYDDPADVERLSALSDDPAPEVRRAACSALGEIDDPTVLPALRRRLQDPDSLTRQIAQQGIARRQHVTGKSGNR
jgi:HEAT repeat protein